MPGRPPKSHALRSTTFVWSHNPFTGSQVSVVHSFRRHNRRRRRASRLHRRPLHKHPEDRRSRKGLRRLTACSRTRHSSGRRCRWCIRSIVTIDVRAQHAARRGPLPPQSGDASQLGSAQSKSPSASLSAPSSQSPGSVPSTRVPRESPVPSPPQPMPITAIPKQAAHAATYHIDSKNLPIATPV